MIGLMRDKADLRFVTFLGNSVLGASHSYRKETQSQRDTADEQ